MASFSSFLITKKFPSKKTLRSLLRGPVTSFVVVVYAIFFAVCAAIFVLLITINNKYLTTVPARGGNLTEGVVGAPHFINPLLATTPTDQRLVALTYSSLMQTDENGNTTTSLAQSYTVSPDGLTYTISLPANSKFSDGKILTSDDVAFTAMKLQDSTISDQSAYWQNISMSTPDPQTIIFTLPSPDTTFLSHLTFGILPKHIWQNVNDSSFASSAQNLHPVGSGLMKVSAIHYSDGIPSTVVLSRNKYATTKILLDHLTLACFANQQALLDAVNNDDVDFSYSVTPDTLSATPLAKEVTTTALSTGTTINIYHTSGDASPLANTAVVGQINQLIDKNSIIATVQHGYGTPIGVQSHAPANSPNTTSIPGTAKGISIEVENDPSVVLAAQQVAQQLAQYGVTVSIKAFDPGTFQQNISNGGFPVIMARSDEMIPSQYSSIISLYTTSVPYLFNTHSHTIPPDILQSPSIEYEHLQDWYTNTDKLWKWFIKKN